MTALTDLQSVLTEFYAQASTPERLSQLQQSLIQFEQDPSSWTLAIKFLSSSDDQYVCMFSLGVLDTTVQKRWLCLSDDDKQTLTLFLEEYAFTPGNSHGTSMISVFKSKATKIWTCACMQNFTQSHPRFLEILGGLLRMPQSITSEDDLQNLSISLGVFKAAIEELVRPDREVGCDKVSENIVFVGRSVPNFFSALTLIAEKLLGSEFVLSVNNTFYCSDTVSEEQFYTSLRHILCFNANVLFAADPEKRKLSGYLLKLICGILGCLNTLLGVVPITSIVDHRSLYSYLYIFTVMGSPKVIAALVDASRSRNLSPAASLGSLSEIGIQSLSCLTEIVERKDVRLEALMQHLSHIFRIIYWDMLMEDPQFPLPSLATSVINILAESGTNLSTAASANNLSGLASLSQSVESTSEDFYQKLANLLGLLVTNFLFFFKSYETDPSSTTTTAVCQSPFAFSPSNFLLRVHFFTFTTCRSILPVYHSCLQLWTSYLDFTKVIYYGSSSIWVGKNVVLPQQTERTISQLCESILSTIYFSESASYLDALDNDDPKKSSKTEPSDNGDSYVAFFDDSLQNADFNDPMDDQSEYGQFMQASLTLLSSIASFNPKDVLYRVAAKFQETMCAFCQLSESCGEKVNLEEHATRKLHSMLQDLATCLNCLAYLSEYFGALEDRSMLQWLLQTLVFNLGAGVTLSGRLSSFREETIRQDIVQVVVENINLLLCILGSGFVVVYENPEDEKTTDEVPSGDVALTIDDKDSLSTTLLQYIHALLLNSPITSLKIPAALLFQGLIVSASPPGFLPPASLLSSDSCLVELVSCCFDPGKLKAFTIPVQRIVVRTVTAYLLIDEAPSPSQLKNNPKRLAELQGLTSEKKNILINRLVPVFTQALQQQNLTDNKDEYFAGLCWLNEALASLAPLGSGSRRVLYEALLSSGILQRLWECLESSKPSPHEAHLFVAHLSFFVQFTDIYGGQKATASLIPSFIATVMRLLQLLQQNTASTHLVSPIVSHLVRLISVLVQNRSVFPSMALDVLRFVSNFLIVNLAGGGMAADLGSTVAAASRNDPDLCLRAFELLFLIMSYGFAHLSDQANLETFLRTLHAVFSPRVFDTRLIAFCLEALCELNQRHRLFSLPVFSTTWSALFSRSFLTLLTTPGGAVQPGSDAESSLIKCLHAIFVVAGAFNAQEFCNTGFYPFLHEVVSLPPEKMQHFSRFASSIAQNGVASQGDAVGFDRFCGIFRAFLSELRQWIRDTSSAQTI